MATKLSSSNKGQADTKPNTPSKKEQNEKKEEDQEEDQETDLLIPYVSDDEDSDTDEEHDTATFGQCWHCSASLPLPTSDASSVECPECGFPN